MLYCNIFVLDISNVPIARGIIFCAKNPTGEYYLFRWSKRLTLGVERWFLSKNKKIETFEQS